MTLFTSKCAAGLKPVPSLNDSLVGKLLFDYTTTADLGLNDIIDLGPFQAGIAPLDVMLVTGLLDTDVAPAITLSVGFLTAAKDDLDGTGLMVDSAIGQTGGVDRMSTTTAMTGGASASARRLGIKVTAAPTAGAGADVKIQVLVKVSA